MNLNDEDEPTRPTTSFCELPPAAERPTKRDVSTCSRMHGSPTCLCGGQQQSLSGMLSERVKARAAQRRRCNSRSC
eukprot:4544145-Prymnesium_polylepis.1